MICIKTEIPQEIYDIDDELKVIDKRKDEVYAPAYWWGIMLLINSIPTKIFKRLTKNEI